MSHFCVLVVGDDVDAQLAPFQENNCDDCPKEYMKFRAYPKDGADAQWFDSEEAAKAALGEQFDEEEAYWENPNRKWDWYSVGGRWAGFFKLKAGATGSVGRPGLMCAPAPEGRYDSARVGDIDFEADREEARVAAAKTFDAYQAIAAAHPKIIDFAQMKEQHEDIEVARAAYHAQSGVAALKAADLMPWFQSLTDAYGCGREAYIQRAVDGVGVPFALLKDGVWYEKGKMGWFGMSSKDKGEDQWAKEYQLLMDGLPKDTVVSLVDCHI